MNRGYLPPEAGLTPQLWLSERSGFIGCGWESLLRVDVALLAGRMPARAGKMPALPGTTLKGKVFDAGS
jgi:hypothetical protein